MSEHKPLLEVRDLAVEFVMGSQAQRVIEGVSFDIHRGETVALVGESGSGKSVTVRSIMGLVPPQAYSVWSLIPNMIRQQWMLSAIACNYSS